MKKIRVLLYVLFCICLYSLLFTFGLSIFIENANLVANLFLIILFIAFLIGLSLFILNLICHKHLPDFKFIRNIKLALIPIYVGFGTICLLCMIGLIVPIIGYILLFFSLMVVFVGYCSVILTGLPNIIFLFKEIFIKKSYNLFKIAALIMHFIFVCDVIISIIMPLQFKMDKNKMQEIN